MTLVPFPRAALRDEYAQMESDFDADRRDFALRLYRGTVKTYQFVIGDAFHDWERTLRDRTCRLCGGRFPKAGGAVGYVDGTDAGSLHTGCATRAEDWTW